MGTPPRVFDLNRPYFVSTATLKRRRIFSAHSNAELMIEVLFQARRKYNFLILSFVVMPDHLHVIVVPRPGDTISQVMRFIKGASSRAYNEAVQGGGAVWQSSFFDRAVRNERDLFRFIGYIEDNPVKAGLVDDSKDYPFCSSNRKLKTDLIPYLAGQG
jgi:REP element-mobilizing transposase RayT